MASRQLFINFPSSQAPRSPSPATDDDDVIIPPIKRQNAFFCQFANASKRLKEEAEVVESVKCKESKAVKFEKPAGVSNGFHVNAINKWLSWINVTSGQSESIMANYHPRPNFCNLLAGDVSAIIDNDQSGPYPLVVKQLYVANGDDRSVQQIVANRCDYFSDFYLERDPCGGYRVKPNTKIYFEVQNVMATYNFDKCVLLCFSPAKDDDFVAVHCKFDKDGYRAAFDRVLEYLGDKCARAE